MNHQFPLKINIKKTQNVSLPR